MVDNYLILPAYIVYKNMMHAYPKHTFNRKNKIKMKCNAYGEGQQNGKFASPIEIVCSNPFSRHSMVDTVAVYYN